MPPPICNLGRKFEHKNGQNLTKVLFFWSSPNFGQENGLILNGEIFFGLHYSQILGTFENPACASGEDNRSRIALKIMIKDENRQINFYPWDYTNFFTVFLTYSALIPAITKVCNNLL